MTDQNPTHFLLDLTSFIQAHQLPAEYADIAAQWFYPLAQSLVEQYHQQQQPLIIGLNGTQGSGKSTLASLLVTIFENAFGLSALAISMDDFYLTLDERQQLAHTIHPLLRTRGVPGTHDTQQAIDVLTSFKNNDLPVTVPRFNKATDDREKETDTLDKTVDIVIFEGWCVGTTPQDTDALLPAINALESNEDIDGEWRSYVNTQLAGAYQKLFALLDTIIMLKAPSFDCVYQWRLEQEDKLRSKAGDVDKVMDAADIARFIQFFQRLTEHTLNTLPASADYVFSMDAARQITQLSSKSDTIHKMAEKQWLIYTDMDGTLLDHHTYSFDAATSALSTLAALSIPVIPITSKTQAELETLRKALDNQHPYIIENGAAVFIPQGYFEHQPEGTELQGEYWVKNFVKPRSHWQKLIKKVSAHYKGQFTTFSKAGIEGIMVMTGLDERAATEASQRQYGEPFQWHGETMAKEEMLNALKALGANILEGGRFVHVSGNTDKGVALDWLTQVFKSQLPRKTIQTLALGDSQNDVAMLESADYAVIVKSPVKAPPTIDRAQNLLMSSNTGPLGWVEGVHHFTQLIPAPPKNHL